MTHELVVFEVAWKTVPLPHPDEFPTASSVHVAAHPLTPATEVLPLIVPASETATESRSPAFIVRLPVRLVPLLMGPSAAQCATG